MSDITPDKRQIEGMEVHLERTFAGYPDKARLKRAKASTNWRKRLWALVDELGFDPSDILQWFRFEFYGKFVGFDCPDLTHFVVPSAQTGFNNILAIVTIHDQPNEAMFQALKKQLGLKKLGAWKWAENKILDEAIGHDDRDPLKGYAIRTRGREEGDEELKNLSANDLVSRRIAAETVFEYQVEFGVHYARTGQFLDRKDTTTLLAGSRTVGGGVPYGGWDPDFRRFFLGSWYAPDDPRDFLRARQVVVS